MTGIHDSPAEPQFTNQTDVLPPNLVKSRSSEIGCCHHRIALKFDRHLGWAAAEVPVKCQSDWKIFETSRDLAVSVCPLREKSPGFIPTAGMLSWSPDKRLACPQATKGQQTRVCPGISGSHWIMIMKSHMNDYLIADIVWNDSILPVHVIPGLFLDIERFLFPLTGLWSKISRFLSSGHP